MTKEGVLFSLQGKVKKGEGSVGALSCKIYLNGPQVSFPILPVQATPGTAECLGGSAGC